MQQGQDVVVPVVLGLFGVAALVLFVGMLGLMALVMSRAIKRRSYDADRGQQMQEAARRLAFAFKPQAQLAELPFFQGFGLFEGYKLGFENLMTGSARGHDVAIFDLVYRNIGDGGPGTTTSRQTMVAVISSSLALPTFYLRPEGMIEAVLDTMNRVDIDFPERPTFSGRFLLYGSDEMAIRRLFTLPRLDALERYPRLCVAGQGNCLYFYTSRTRAQPAGVERYAGFTEQLHDIFRS